MELIVCVRPLGTYMGRWVYAPKLPSNRTIIARQLGCPRTGEARMFSLDI